MPSALQQDRTISLLDAPDTDIGDPLAKAVKGQVFRLDLSQEVINSLSGGSFGRDVAQISFGKAPTLRYGTACRDLDITQCKFRHELYYGTNEGASQKLSFAGLLSYSVTLKEPQEATTDSNAGVAALKQRLASAQNDKESHQTTFVDEIKSAKRGANLPKKATPLHRQNNFGSQMPKSIPTSPLHGATLTPSARSQERPTSSLLFQDPTSLKTKAVRVPMLHLLAIRPISEVSIVRKVRAPKEICSMLLEKFGDKAPGDKMWQLNDRWYQELDVWKFGYSSAEDRQSAIDNAVRAFDRKRLSRDDKHWQLLLPKDQRGRGIVLSKLQLKNGALNPSSLKPSTPKIPNALSPSHQRTLSSPSHQRNLSSGSATMAPAVSQDKEHSKKTSENRTEAKAPPIKASATKPSPPRGTRGQTGQTKSKAGQRRRVDNKIKSEEFVQSSDDDDDNDQDELSKDKKGHLAETRSTAKDSENIVDSSRRSSESKHTVPAANEINAKEKSTTSAHETASKKRNHSGSFGDDSSSLSSISSKSSPHHVHASSASSAGSAASVVAEQSSKRRKVDKSALKSSPPATSPIEAKASSPKSSSPNYNFFKGSPVKPTTRVIRSGNVASSAYHKNHGQSTKRPLPAGPSDVENRRSATKTPRTEQSGPDKSKERQSDFEKFNTGQKSKTTRVQLPELDLVDLKEQKRELHAQYLSFHLELSQMVDPPEAKVAEACSMYDQLRRLKLEIARLEDKSSGDIGASKLPNNTTKHLQSQYEMEYSPYIRLYEEIRANKNSSSDDLKKLWAMHLRLLEIQNLMDEISKDAIMGKVRSDINAGNPLNNAGPLSRRQTLIQYAKYYEYVAKYEAAHASLLKSTDGEVTIQQLEEDWKMRIRLEDMHKEIMAGFAQMGKGLEKENSVDEEFTDDTTALTEEELKHVSKRFASDFDIWFALRSKINSAPFGSVEPSEMQDLWDRQANLKKWRWQIWRASKRFTVDKQLA